MSKRRRGAGDIATEGTLSRFFFVFFFTILFLSLLTDCPLVRYAACRHPCISASLSLPCEKGPGGCEMGADGSCKWTRACMGKNRIQNVGGTSSWPLRTDTCGGMLALFHEGQRIWVFGC